MLVYRLDLPAGICGAIVRKSNLFPAAFLIVSDLASVLSPSSPPLFACFCKRQHNPIQRRLCGSPTSLLQYL